jgi:adenosylcobinamide kinase/adenosylcobinamide-phosphate guanylyltransferase
VLKVFIGGARSGKSGLALRLAKESGLPVSFIATATTPDAEFAARIERHRAERPSDWVTIEAPVDLLAALQSRPRGSFAIVDCLTLWVANLMERGLEEDEIVQRALDVATACARDPAPVVVVSNDVGSGIVPLDALSRAFRDALGRANAQFAAIAEKAYYVVGGLVVPLADLGVAVIGASDGARMRP